MWIRLSSIEQIIKDTNYLLEYHTLIAIHLMIVNDFVRSSSEVFLMYTFV